MSASRTALYSLILLVVILTGQPGLESVYSQTIASTHGSEVRGVWVHPGFFGPEKKTALPKIQSTLDAYLQAGINTLVFMVKSTSGQVYYRSRIGPVDSAWQWDIFGTFLEEARKRSMVVHPWFCVFTEGGILGEVRRHPEWLIRSKKSEMISAVNPALPQVRQYEISLIKELVDQYPVEWIHLDYIRYPCEPTEVYFSFDKQTRADFKEYSGEDPLSIKAMDSGNILWNEWIEWNAGQVSKFLRELRDTLKTSGRSVKISAAVFPSAANARVLIGQDWALWAEGGLVDMLCPMLYTNNHVYFEKYTRRALEIAKGRCQASIGIGIGTSHNQNTTGGMLQQMKISRDLGADGTIFFSSSSLTPEFLEALKKFK